MPIDPSPQQEQQHRIVYMGTPDFAAIILEGLLQSGWPISGVVTQPDRPRGRGRKVSLSPVSSVAKTSELPLLQPYKMKDDGFLKSLNDLQPDLIVVAAYGKILPPEILSLPRLGCFNIHASLLPAYRGAGPIQQAILMGEKQTGITIFRMEAGVDTGDMIASEPLDIGPEETAGELTERLALLAARMLTPILRELVRGRATFTPQNNEKATFAPVLKKEDGRIDWSHSAETICNRIRAMDPWPGAFTFIKGKRLRIWQASIEKSDVPNPPGEILAVSKQDLIVQTGAGGLCLKALQGEGKKRMTAGDFIRGNKLQAGERLG